MNSVRRTHNTFVPGLVEIVEGGVAHTDVEPIGWPGKVCGLAGGAQIHPVLLLILDSLQDPELPG